MSVDVCVKSVAPVKWVMTFFKWLASTMLWFVRSLATFVANVLVSLMVNMRLAWNKKNSLHVLFEELHRPWAPRELVCIYSPSGRRTFFVKDGRLNPQVLIDGKSFEKMKTSKKTAFGRLIGDAATAAGDDPVLAKVAKGALRTTMSCPGSGVLPVLNSVAPAIKSMFEKSTSPLSLYEAMHRACILAIFPAMMGSSIEQNIPKDMSVDELVKGVDRIANAGVTSKEKSHDALYSAIRTTFESAFATAPEGSFGRSLLEMKGKCPDLPLSASLSNAVFYWNAVSSVSSNVIYHFVLMMVRNPHHCEKALGDRQHFRRCLKETLRLFHPVSGLMPRRSRKDVQVGSTIVPRSSFVVVIPSLQVEDTEFRPERWAHNDTISDAEYENVVYAPFSSGSRACLMRSYGGQYLEDLVWDVFSPFDFELVSKDVLRGKHPAEHHISDIGIAFRPVCDYEYRIKVRL